MRVQNHERTETPLDERIRYFVEVMTWCTVAFIILVVLIIAIDHVFFGDRVPAFTGNPDYSSDRAFCLEIRPKEELRACLDEYGWFDKPAVFQLEN